MAKPRRSSGKQPSGPPARFQTWNGLSPDRKLDIIGVALTLTGLLTLLSLFSDEHAVLTGWWVTFITRLVGWGAYILSAALILLGVWLVLRNIEQLPRPSTERLAGVVLLFVNILAWMSLIPVVLYGVDGWSLAQAGEGGGIIGSFFEELTVAALGEAGASVVFTAWLVIAIALTLDITVSEIFDAIEKVINSLVHRIMAKQEAITAAREAAAAGKVVVSTQAEIIQSGQGQNGARSVPELDPYGQPVSSELPPDFRPFQPGQPAGTAASGASAAGRSRGPRTASGVAAAAAAGSTTPAASGSASAAAAGVSPGQRSTPKPVWKRPVIADLLEPPAPETATTDRDKERGELIEDTLKSFGVPVKVVATNHGPTVTQFGVEPQLIITRNAQGEEKQTRVRVSRIVSLADDLALALAAPRIRIQAPVPGRNYVGIEVPNLEVSRVALREVMESEAFRKLKSPLRFALGKDVAGNARCYDLAAMPHLLIAGTTGSGKSVLVNALLTCLLLNNTPTDLRMILVDPKRVELTGYNGIPHLLAPVVVEAEQVVGALQWVQREMDARYHRFSQVGTRNIADYNARFPESPLPYMLVLIDELADLMMLAPDETERSLTRLAQLARATGIHLVIATQRPSVDVVTGLIKANFPARVAFAVASGIDSRVILDQPGAERLLGRGDMLFQAPDAAAPVRLQGVYVSDPESQALVEYWRQQAYELRNVNLQTPTAIPVNMDMPLNAPLKQGPLFDNGDKTAGDPLLPEAIKIVREEGRASISMLQRKLRIGYTRSARLVDTMEEQGIIGPAQPTSQVREVLDMGAENDAETSNSIGDE
ncbi:MAG: DNA translocase FtsK [Chloroflexi bacterium]|nr:MAG: DNA translocase FtsK [Chloroflexota bacterium]